MNLWIVQDSAPNPAPIYPDGRPPSVRQATKPVQGNIMSNNGKALLAAAIAGLVVMGVHWWNRPSLFDTL